MEDEIERLVPNINLNDNIANYTKEKVAPHISYSTKT